MPLNIGLIADTHIPEARATLWPQVYEAFDGVDRIFHAGDIHELWVLDTLEEIAPVYAARGNGEDGSGGRDVQPEDPRLRYAWSLPLENLTVGLTHYIPANERPPDFTVARWVERFFPDKTPDVIVYGDTTHRTHQRGGRDPLREPRLTHVSTQLRHAVRDHRVPGTRRRRGAGERLADQRQRHRTVRLGRRAALAATLTS